MCLLLFYVGLLCAFPRDCTMGTPLGGTTQGTLEGYPGRVLSTVVELTWLIFLLRDIKVPQSHPPILFCDNFSALHMTFNLVFHACSKHIELDYHFVHERVSMGLLITPHVSSTIQFVDIFRKPLCKTTLHHFHSKLCL